MEEEAGRCRGQRGFSRCFSVAGCNAGSTAQNLDGHFIPTRFMLVYSLGAICPGTWEFRVREGMRWKGQKKSSLLSRSVLASQNYLRPPYHLESLVLRLLPFQRSGWTT